METTSGGCCVTGGFSYYYALLQPFILIGYITHSSLCSQSQIKGFSVEYWVKTVSEKLTLIWKCVPSQHGCFFMANVNCGLSLLQIFTDVPSLSKTEQHIWPFPLHLTSHSTSPDQVSYAGIKAVNRIHGSVTNLIKLERKKSELSL